MIENLSLDPQHPPKLEYYGVSAPRRRYRQWRGFWFVDALVVPKDPQLRKWWIKRVCYYLGVLVMFLTIGFYVGPNEFLFGKIIYPYHSLADFVPEVQTECVPVVRAIKEYERDNGQLPTGIYELAPQYLPSAYNPGMAMYDKFYFAKGDHLIYYDFTKGSEGWFVIGPIQGTIPAPLVTGGPATRRSMSATQ